MKLSRLIPLMVLASLALPSWAFDWGGSLEESSSSLVVIDKFKDGNFAQTGTLRGWVSWNFDRGTSLLIKASIPDSFTLPYDPASGWTNTVLPNLDTFEWSTKSLWMGRNTVSDFGNTVLNTTIDGAQWSPSFGDWDLKLALGTSAFLFKSGSTVIVSQADLTDRTIDQNWGKPETLWAAKRVIGMAQVTNEQLVDGIKLQASEIAQYDLRTDKTGKPDGAVTTNDGAPVHMSYTGLGGSGKIGGGMFWSASGYLGLGYTLTPVSSVWKPTLIANGLFNADLTWLMPELNYTIVDLGVQVGSWDEDGQSPDLNAPKDGKASPYTGFFGVSRTSSALIFNPQPTNMITTQLLWSFKPLGNGKKNLDLQVLANLFAFIRPSTYAIAETSSGLMNGSSDYYLASEADLTLAIRPASDWGGNMSAGLLLPSKTAIAGGVKYKLQAGLNMSF